MTLTFTPPNKEGIISTIVRADWVPEGCSLDTVIASAECEGLSSSILWRVLLNNTRIGQFSISPIPGNSSVGVIHRTFIEPHYRGGITAQSFHYAKESLAIRLGFKMVIATVDMANYPALGAMLKNKYKLVSSYNDGNKMISLGVKQLDPATTR